MYGRIRFVALTILVIVMLGWPGLGSGRGLLPKPITEPVQPTSPVPSRPGPHFP